jgi:hypothetical protein
MEKIKSGDRVLLVNMVDDPNPIKSGTKGTVEYVDSLGTIHVQWDDGRTLGLIPGYDEFKVIKESTNLSSVKSGISKISTNVNKSMPKSSSIPSDIKSSLKSSGIKTNSVTNNFKSANIKDVKVEQDGNGDDLIKGGKADEMTIKDLSKKHNVSITDIEKELKIGIEVEKEHVGDDLKKAKEIAMDHIYEFPDYYSNKKYGVLSSEKGLKKDNKKRKLNTETTSTAGGASTGSYVSPIGFNKKTMKETTLSKNSGFDDTYKESWADKNNDGWVWNDNPVFKDGEIVDEIVNINAVWNDTNLDISKEWGSLQNKKLKKEDVFKMVKNIINEKYEIVNDKKLDSIKDNFKPPHIEDEEDVIDETTTTSSVWGPNGPPVGPSFAAKQGDWTPSKKPIWKGGKIIQKIENSGVLNPITENKVKIGDTVKIKKEYGGGKGEVVDIVKSFIVVKTPNGNKSYHMSDLIIESNKVKYNPKGKYVKIKKKCLRYPYCSQGSLDNPIKISDTVKEPGTYVEMVLTKNTLKNICEVVGETGKPFNEIYNKISQNLKKSVNE